MATMQALGMIETKGLVASVEAADAMVKAADVTLIGKVHVGGGLVTVMVRGDVGAVKAAVEAATAACAKGRGVWGTKVIARPSEGIDKLIYNNQTVGYIPPEEPKAEEPKAETVIIEENEETAEENTEE